MSYSLSGIVVQRERPSCGRWNCQTWATRIGRNVRQRKVDDGAVYKGRRRSIEKPNRGIEAQGQKWGNIEH